MYLKTIFISSLVILCIVSSLNLLIDPYRLFFSPNIENINIKKPRSESQIYFNRAVGIKNNNAKTLLLGNSRVHWGLHASSVFWDNNEVYNAAIAGGNIQTSYEYLKFSAQNTKLEKVIIGLDYYRFLTDSIILENSPVESPLVIGNYTDFLSNNMFIDYPNFAKRLVSLDAFIDSFITIFNQGNIYSPDITVKGDNPVNEYNGHVADKGHLTLFNNNLAGTANTLKSQRRIFNNDHKSQNFESLKRIIQLCADQNIKLVLYIHPYHVELMAQLVKLERWEEFVDWKRQIASETSVNNDIELWDFSIDSKYIREPIPGIKSNAEMTWYWEAGHYKNTLGDEIIKTITKKTKETSPVFGQRVYQKSDISDIPPTANYKSVLSY